MNHLFLLYPVLYMHAPLLTIIWGQLTLIGALNANLPFCFFPPSTLPTYCPPMQELHRNQVSLPTFPPHPVLCPQSVYVVSFQDIPVFI